MNLDIEKEMVNYFILKSKRERTYWELSTPRKRSSGIGRFCYGEYLNRSLFVELNGETNEKIMDRVKRNGGGNAGYLLTWRYSGEIDLRRELETARQRNNSFLYMGNGIAYYFEEWYAGKTPEYLLISGAQLLR